MVSALAAAQSDFSFPALRFILGFVLILIGGGCAKTGVITRPPPRRGEWLSGYQGDGPLPGGLSRKSDPLTFYYVIVCMYLVGAYLIGSAAVLALFS
jgi:hypothetical protein